MKSIVEQSAEFTGNPVHRMQIVPDEFRAFKALYQDDREGIDDQKLLEYFISYKFLDFQPSDTYIDIAAQNCPFAFFVRERFGCQVYRQDLYYMNKGVHGEDIGGDASRLPLKRGSVSKMSLHNSFEHFEGNSDIRFIREAQRVLKVGGKMIIVPLFIEEEYQVETEAGWIDESGEKQLWNPGARFSRIYNLDQFKERVIKNARAFKVRFFHIENVQEIDPSCYSPLFVIFEKVQSKPWYSWIFRGSAATVWQDEESPDLGV
jgi:SAM-dependent methyltransferase